MTEENLTPAQESLRQTWEEHLRHEFETKDTEQTLATMVEDAHVNHIPVMTGGMGREGLREFSRSASFPKCLRTWRSFRSHARLGPIN